MNRAMADCECDSSEFESPVFFNEVRTVTITRYHTGTSGLVRTITTTTHSHSKPIIGIVCYVM